MEHNVLTGTTSARLHKLVLKDQQGTYQNILDLMATNADLLQIYVGGVLYSNVAALNFTNPEFYLDSVSGIMNIGQQAYQSYLRLGNSTTNTDLTRGSNGELLWNNDPMASQALVTHVQTDLQTNLDGTVAYVQGSFQGKLATLSESTTDAVLLQSLDASNLHIAWGKGPNISFTNQTGFQTFTQTSLVDGGVYISIVGQVPGAVFRFSFELMAGTKTSLLILNTDGANSASQVIFEQSMSNTWQTVVWDYGPTQTGNASLILEPNNGQYVRDTGTFYLRNLRVTQAVVVANFSQDVVIAGECTAQALRLGDNTAYTDLTRGSAGELLWDGNPVTALAHYSESSGATTTIAQGQDTLTPISLHIAWAVGGGGGYSNVAGSHQELTLPHLGIGYFNQPAGTKVYLSIDLKAGSLTEAVFAVHDGSAFFDAITIQGLSGANWVTYTWAFVVTTAGSFVFGVGRIPTNLGVNMSYTSQNSGTVLIRNLHLYTTGDLATISAPLTCEKDVTFNTSIQSQHAYIINSITAAQYFSSSDERLKTSIQDASLQSCQQVFDAVEVKTYERTDLAPGKRIGFIAQDVVQSNLPEEFANLVGTRPGGDAEDPFLTLDYSRLVTVLWGVVKNLQARIEALEAE